MALIRHSRKIAGARALEEYMTSQNGSNIVLDITVNLSNKNFKKFARLKFSFGHP